MTHHPTLIVVWLVFVACVTVGYLVAVLGPWAPSWPRGGFGK